MEVKNEVRGDSTSVDSANEDQCIVGRSAWPMPDPIEKALITHESSARTELCDTGPADGFASDEREGEQVLAEALKTVVWHSHFRLP